MVNLEIVNPLAQAYAEKYTTPEDELLREIADYTNRISPAGSNAEWPPAREIDWKQSVLCCIRGRYWK